MIERKYHTVRTVPRSMKNNKIPHCQNSSKIHGKQQNTTLSEQFQDPRKITKYHTVRTVPRSTKNNEILHCQNNSNIHEKQQNTTLSEQFQDQT